MCFVSKSAVTMTSHQSLLDLGQQIAGLKFAPIGPGGPGGDETPNELKKRVVDNFLLYAGSENGTEGKKRSFRALRDFIKYAYSFYMADNFDYDAKKDVIEEQAKRLQEELKALYEQKGPVQIVEYLNDKVFALDQRGEPSKSYFVELRKYSTDYSFVLEDLRDVSRSASSKARMPLNLDPNVRIRTGYIDDFIRNPTDANHSKLRTEIITAFGNYLREHQEKLFVWTRCFDPQFRSGIDFGGEYENVIVFQDMLNDAFPEYKEFDESSDFTQYRSKIWDLFNASIASLVRRNVLNKYSKEGMQFFTKDQISSGDLESPFLYHSLVWYKNMGFTTDHVYFLNTEVGISTINQFLRDQRRLHQQLYENYLDTSPPKNFPFGKDKNKLEQKFQKKYKLQA